MDIYKEKASEIARTAHAHYCQRMPGFDPEAFSANVARAIRDALVEAAGGRLSVDAVPDTDAHVEQRIRIRPGQVAKLPVEKTMKLVGPVDFAVLVEEAEENV